MHRVPFIFIIFCLILISCSDDDSSIDSGNPTNPLAELNLPDTPFNYANIQLPNYLLQNAFPPQIPFQHAAIELDNTPANNPITDAGATLGRVLFYDKRLSANGSISCASCHQAAHGFSDPEVQSTGFEGGHTRRHSMGLVNA